MRHLIYQLAEQHTCGLRSRRNDIKEALGSPLWSHVTPLNSFPEMTQTLAMLMEDFDEGIDITIVIDQLDRCSWSTEPDSEVNALQAAVSALLQVV